MGTTQVILREVSAYHSGLKTNFQESPEQSQPTVEATDAINTMIMSQNEYQSILPLKGKYANDPSWKEFPDFLEEYDRQINDLYKE